MTMTDRERDLALYDALVSAGVDSWEWYQASVGHLNGDPRFLGAAPEQRKLLLLGALEAGGVGDWAGFSDAVATALDRHRASDTSASITAARRAHPSPAPEAASEALLRELAGAEYESLRAVFWKRSHAPKQFDLALRQTPPGEDFIERVRMRYLDLMFTGA